MANSGSLIDWSSHDVISGATKRFLLGAKYIQGIFGLNPDDIVLAAFPKVGSTWVRFFMRNLISLGEENGEPVTFPILDATMPELGVSNLMRTWPYMTIPRFVKTHRAYLPIFRRTTNVLLVRDPRDVMVSYYRHVTAELNPRFNGPFHEFVRHKKFGLRAWFRHFRSWKDNHGCCIRYEDLKRDDVATFRGMLDDIGIDVPVSLIEGAAERSRFDQVRAIERQYGLRANGRVFKEGRRFTRAGLVGGWKELFSSDLIGLYSALRSEHGLQWYGVE